MKLLVLGAGAWGTALAMSASQNAQAGHEVRLWARDPAQAAAMRSARVNARYLPELPLPAALQVIDGPAEDLQRLVQDQD
ncbi:MAG: glycerol-3-phosphate dehydrogenase, partial [Curvibacter sp.]